MTSSTQANSTPKVAVNDIGSEEAFLAAIDETIKYFNDGNIVEGTVVKVNRDEVLLDIGSKTEGVIPSRNCRRRNVDPHNVVHVGEHIETCPAEGGQGQVPILSKKRAQYERAWGTIEKIKEEDGVVTGAVIEVVKGGLILDIGLRGSCAASWWKCAGSAICSRMWARRSKPRSSSWTRTATTWSSTSTPGWSRRRSPAGGVGPGGGLVHRIPVVRGCAAGRGEEIGSGAETSSSSSGGVGGGVDGEEEKERRCGGGGVGRSCRCWRRSIVVRRRLVGRGRAAALIERERGSVEASVLGLGEEERRGRLGHSG